MTRIAACPYDSEQIIVSDGVLPDLCPTHAIPLVNIIQGSQYSQSVINQYASSAVIQKATDWWNKTGKNQKVTIIEGRIIPWLE